MNILATILLMILRWFEVDDKPEPITIPPDILELQGEISAIEHFMYDAEVGGGFWYDIVEAKAEHARLVNKLDKRMGYK